jgi:hypothetical protein
MRSFVLAAAGAALIAAALDGCNRFERPHRSHKEPHAFAAAAVGWVVSRDSDSAGPGDEPRSAP